MTDEGGRTGTSASITVNPAGMVNFGVTTQNGGTETAGAPFSVTLTAKDSYGNTATGYTGAHAIAWTWTATASPNGTAPGFAVSAPAAVTSGVSFSITVTARDAYGNVTTGYAGSRALVYSGPASEGGVNPRYTTPALFTAGATAALPTTLFKAEQTVITVTYDGISGTSAVLTVNYPSSSGTVSTSASATVDKSLGDIVSFADGSVRVIVPPAGSGTVEVEIRVSDVRPEQSFGSLVLAGRILDLRSTDSAGQATGLPAPATVEVATDDRVSLPLGAKRALYYWNEERQRWIYLGGEYTAPGRIAAEVPRPAKVAVLYDPARPILVDVSRHWAARDIDRLVGLGIVSGFGDRTFRPEKTVTRAEFAKFLVEAAGYKPAADARLDARDGGSVPAWARGYLAAAIELGLMKGYEDDTLRPNGIIDCAQMITMIGRALGWRQGPVRALSFRDQGRIPEWARPYVAEAERRGVVTGRNGNVFDPGTPSTRAEAAAMLVRMLKQMGIY